ncbi:MAG: hypothetical protein LBB24_02555 [Rickettsiales bacterium]|jgi:UDP-N-acetylmuramoylalanine-D-glutamate ligase|nr:hypothetical protein [Rickettsiales bacterium]
MSINDLRGGGKTVVMLGTDDTGAVLGKTLASFGNEVSFWDPYGESTSHHRFEAGALVALEDIETYPLESTDYIILSQKLFLGEDNPIERFERRIKKLEDRIFLDVEIAKTLFYKNKLVAVVGEGYAKIIHAALDCIFKNSPLRATILPTRIVEPPGTDENISAMEGGPGIGLDLSEGNVFVMDLDERKMQYLKNVDFDVVAIFSAEPGERRLAGIEKFLSKQTVNGISIINRDNDVLREFWNGPRSGDSATVLIPISTDRMIENGYSYVSETIYNYYDSNVSHDLTNDKLIGTRINRLSVLSSFIVATRFGLDPSTVTANLRFFRGLAGKMEYLRQSNSTLFINNACANSLDILESPLKAYSNIYIILITNGKVRENMISLRNHRDNIKSVFLLDAFDVVSPESEEFSGIDVKKVNSIREAVSSIVDSTTREMMNEETEKEEEGEFVVLISPIFIDKMNDNYYESQSEEFRRIIENL